MLAYTYFLVRSAMPDVLRCSMLALPHRVPVALDTYQHPNHSPQSLSSFNGIAATLAGCPH